MAVAIWCFDEDLKHSEAMSRSRNIGLVRQALSFYKGTILFLLSTSANLNKHAAS